MDKPELLHSSVFVSKVGIVRDVAQRTVYINVPTVLHGTDSSARLWSTLQAALIITSKRQGRRGRTTAARVV